MEFPRLLSMMLRWTSDLSWATLVQEARMRSFCCSKAVGQGVKLPWTQFLYFFINWEAWSCGIRGLFWLKWFLEIQPGCVDEGTNVELRDLVRVMKLAKHKAAKIWVSSFSPRTHSAKVLSVKNLRLFPLPSSEVRILFPFQTVQVCFPTTSSYWVKNQSASLSPHAILVTYLQGFSLSSWHQTRVEARISLWTGSRFIRGTHRQARILIPSNFQFPRETLLWVWSKSVLWSDARNCWTEGGIECRDAPSTGRVGN